MESQRYPRPGTAESFHALLPDKEGCSTAASRPDVSTRAGPPYKSVSRIARRTWWMRRCRELFRLLQCRAVPAAFPQPEFPDPSDASETDRHTPCRDASGSHRLLRTDVFGKGRDRWDRR